MTASLPAAPAGPPELLETVMKLDELFEQLSTDVQPLEQLRNTAHPSGRPVPAVGDDAGTASSGRAQPHQRWMPALGRKVAGQTPAAKTDRRERMRRRTYPSRREAFIESPAMNREMYRL
jgi:hypothetical protein